LCNADFIAARSCKVLKLDRSVFAGRTQWEQAGIHVPSFDYAAVCRKTDEEPRWIHFGAGNIFRAYVADIAQSLLENHDMESGIIAADTFDFELLDKVYKVHDNLALLAIMHADGTTEKRVIASVTESIHADSHTGGGWDRLRDIFAAPSLQLVSFTITEKGYAVTGMDGNLLPGVEKDIAVGPSSPVQAMSVLTALMYERYRAGAFPIALVSMDNCSHNGEKLESAVLKIAREWCFRGFVDDDFIEYLENRKKVSFPWSMIDKITPRPSPRIQKIFEDLGVADIAPVVTSHNTYVSPFVNAESAHYLVIEDDFPNGRPPLDRAGVFLGTRDMVNKCEKMKVTTCLNPLHTALAVYGCLLGYDSIAAEMKDADLVTLIKKIGYDEGLPVVTNPGILDPKAFIDEVVLERLPNPNIPDMPQRIASDTSQKIPVRYGETIKSYIAEHRDLGVLVGIPLAIAGWLRYLLAVDDAGNHFEPSADPMLAQLQQSLAGVQFGHPESIGNTLDPILSNEVLFGTDLTKTVLAEKIKQYFKSLSAGPGAVRQTLHQALEKR
jgi:fructuronate reductase